MARKISITCFCIWVILLLGAAGLQYQYSVNRAIGEAIVSHWIFRLASEAREPAPEYSRIAIACVIGSFVFWLIGVGSALCIVVSRFRRARPVPAPQGPAEAEAEVAASGAPAPLHRGSREMA